MINEDEKEKGQPFFKTLKQNYFILMGKTLTNSEIGFLMVFLIKVIELLILLSFSFHDQLDFQWEPEDLYTNFFKWINTIRLAFLISLTKSVLVLDIFFGACGFVVLCWLLVGFGLYCASSGHVPNIIILLLKVIMPLFPGIIYIEIIELVVQMFNCTATTSKGSYIVITETFSSKIYCWDTVHIIYICISCFFLLLTLGFNLMVVLFDLEMKMKSKNCLARATNKIELFELLHQTLIVVMIVIFGNEFKKVVALTFLFGAFIKLLLALFLEPYHYKNTQILVLASSAIEFWVNLALNIKLLFGWMKFSMNSLLALIGSPMFAVMIVYLWLEKSTNVLQLKSKNTKSYDLYLKIRKLIEIYENFDDAENAVWLNGLLSKHIQHCRKDSCLFHEAFNSIIAAGSAKLQESQKVYRSYIIMKYRKIIRSNPQNVFIRIVYALYLSEYVKNSVYALLELEEAQELNPSITEELLLLRYKRLFESELAEEKILVNKMTQSNIELAIKFEVLYTKFNKALLASAAAFSELWGYLKNETAASFQLEKMIKRIYDDGKAVEKIWEDILQIKGDIPKTLYIYAQYLFKIINDPKAAIDLDKKARTEEIIQAQSHQENELILKDMRNINDYASDGTPCIYISAVPEKIGQITNMNMTACQLFGYTKNSVMSKNIKALIPDIIGKHHNRILILAEQKEVSYFNRRKDFYSYGRQMSGYILPMHLKVKKVLSFSLEGDQFAALMYPVIGSAKSQEMHMLIDNKLRITDLTETCFRVLKLKKDIVKKQKISITTLIPEFPTQERLEREIGDAEERHNQMIFIETEMDVYIPRIMENGRDDSNLKMKFRNDDSDREEDSVLSALRKNEVVINDSFYDMQHLAKLDNLEEETDEQEENKYTIETNSEDKLHCKVGISSIYAMDCVGYAVKITIINNETEAIAAMINQRIGSYQLEFHMRGNCFIRVPLDSNGKPRHEEQVQVKSNA